jgi:hypothetical protein
MNVLEPPVQNGLRFKNSTLWQFAMKHEVLESKEMFEK